MSIQMILGGSGSGKTEYMFGTLVREAQKHPSKNYLVIVPEQFTLQTQKKLVELSENQVIMNVDVLSFKRLAYRVFDDLGMTTATVLEETGKNLVLRRVAQEQEEKLTVLRPNINRMGYISEVKSLISELMQYHISDEELENLKDSRRLSPILSAKLSDVVTLYRGFSEFLKGSYLTAEEILEELARVAPESELLRNSVIAFDEFTGFTPIQNELLSVMMPLADRMMFALTIDDRENFYVSRGSYELFDLPKKTIQILMDTAKRQQVEILDPVVLRHGDQKRYAQAQELYFLEQNLFRRTYQKWKQPVERISLHSLRNPREELTYVAREIQRLIRSGDYRYREIAVVTGAVENYSGYVEDIFGKYKIPYFLDMTKDAMFHPFIEFIRSSLGIVAQDFSYASMMRFLRCGFCGFTDREMDQLDNYLLATGIHGRNAWNRRWLRKPHSFEVEVVEEMEGLRQRVMEQIAPMLEVFSTRQEKRTAEEEIVGLYRMITGIGVEQQLWEREKELAEEGQQVLAMEYGQIYPIVMDLLDKYVAILGQETFTLSEFAELLDAGLDAAQVAVIPPGYDNVTVGDIERTRLNHIKVLFFIGVNDDVIPKSEGRGGILSQYEREQLEQTEIQLAPGAREQTFIQRYYLYLNVTKPSRKLYLSFVRTNSEGKAVRPSYLIGVIQRIFPELKEQEIDRIETSPDYSTPEAARDYLIFGERDENWAVLAKCFQKEEKTYQWLLQMLDAEEMHYEDDDISQVIAKALYGNCLETSVTRLERFASCAYAHFLQYGLRLKEREHSGFAQVDMGTLYHNALEKYSHKLEESGYDWFTVVDAVRDELAVSSMQEAVAEYGQMGIHDTAADQHMLKRMEHILQQTVWALTMQVRKGSFVPQEYEISFDNLALRQMREYSMDKNTKLVLNGRIDRIDTCLDEDKCYVKVVDYKSGKADFSLLKIYQGTQLQLMIYMNAAVALEREKHPDRKIVPGGVLYYHIDDPVIEKEGELSEEEAGQALLELLRPDGVVGSEEEIYRKMDTDLEGKSLVIPLTLKKNGGISERGSQVISKEEFQVLQEYVSRKVRENGSRILKGEISINPIESGKECSCTYCPYPAVCCMDPKVEGYSFRHPKNLKREEIIEAMKTAITLEK